MLCAKCQKNEASVHVTTIMHESGEEIIHLCNDCGSEVTRAPAFDPSQLEVWPIIGRKCEFCGKEAFSKKKLAGGGGMYWCFDCEAEYRRTFSELFFHEHPDLLEQMKAPSFPQQVQGWLDEVGERVVQILKEKGRRGNDRDAAS